MDTRSLQTALAALGHDPGAIDGRAGADTLAAAGTLLDGLSPRPPYDAWSPARRLVAAEQAIYLAAGIPAGPVDGLAGAQTRYAREIWDARRVESWRDDEDATPILSPAAARTVWPTLAEVRTGRSIFGGPGTRQTMIQLAYPMRLAWDTDTVVTRMQCHELVAPALDTIWRETLTHYGADGIRALRLDLFGGSYNNRSARGSSKISAHAWGIAVDMDPERNGLKMTAREASFDGPEYDAWWRIIESTGAISLGRTHGYDWMHFQFCR